MKVSTSYPDNVPGLGVWIGDSKEDVHIDFESQTLVIGHNLDIPHMKFTPQALCFNKDGSLTYQFKGADGEAKQVPVCPKLVRGLLLGLLTTVENAVA